MPVTNLQEKFVHDLGDIYDAEHRFLQAMQQMLQQAQSPMVQQMLQTHIQETQQQIQNLDQVFQLLGQQPKRVTCEASAGIVSEGQKTLKELQGNPALVDLGIGGSAARVEHYEIAVYRGLITAAEFMGQNQIVQLLRQNLQQEEKTAKLVEQAEPQLLQQAAGGQLRAR